MLSSLNRFLFRLVCAKEGASFTEYGALLLLVVAAVGAAALTLGTDISALLGRVSAYVNGVVQNPGN